MAVVAIVLHFIVEGIWFLILAIAVDIWAAASQHAIEKLANGISHCHRALKSAIVSLNIRDCETDGGISRAVIVQNHG
jgi:hypothetical protein